MRPLLPTQDAELAAALRAAQSKKSVSFDFARREAGNEMEAARRFQYLAASAERDDLFTIAIDGILKLRAQQQSGLRSKGRISRDVGGIPLIRVCDEPKAAEACKCLGS